MSEQSGTYAADYGWQLKYHPEVARIITTTMSVASADVRFTSPESHDDRHFNTDILVMEGGHVRRMSLRLRRYVIGDEFTLRYMRPESPTEWQKL